MKNASLLLLCVPILSGCALFGEPSEQEYDIFARPLENRIVEVPVYGLEEVVNEDGTTELVQKQVGTKEVTIPIEVGPALAEEISGLVAPFSSPYGGILIALAGILAGWYTRSKKEELEKQSELESE